MKSSSTDPPFADPGNPASPESAEEWYRILAQTAPDAILIIDEHSTILSANPAAERIFGYSIREMVGQPLMMLIPERLRAAHENGIRRHLETGRRNIPWTGYELPGLTKAGEEIPLEISFGESVREGHRIYAGFIRDIRARKAIEAERETLLAEARSARGEAEQANRAKSVFLSTMSHEIRTPINAIMGYSDLLGLEIEGPLTEGQRGQLQRIRASSDHLLTLVNDVLDLAKVEAGEMKITRQKAAVHHAAGEAAAMVVPLAAQRGVQLENRCRENPDLPYLGDPDRVRQILVNLLSNAIKFTREGGSVLLSCGTGDPTDEGLRLYNGGPWTCISVEDTGVGIESGDLEAIFNPFQQVQGGLTRRAEGSGMGLTISRQLARLMGGDLSATSTPGKGSVFTVWLPRDFLVTNVTPDELVGLMHRDGLLARVGEALREGAEAIMDELVARLRSEPAIPDDESFGKADYEDHIATFLSDLGQHLIILDTSEADPAHLLRDGSEIQRMIAELHGAQRARLGWSEDALRREFEILLEEVQAELGRRRDSRLDEDREIVAEFLERLIRRAGQTSLAGFRRWALAGSV